MNEEIQGGDAVVLFVPFFLIPKGYNGGQQGGKSNRLASLLEGTLSDSKKPNTI